MHKRRGFTLIELLVVIAIIALLMSILMPALGRTRKQALAVAGLSREHQWGVVFSIYTNKNGGAWHRRTIGAGGPGGYASMWHRAYEPYYQDREMLCCPAANNPNRDLDTFSTWGGPNWEAGIYGAWEAEGYYGSYGFNRYVVDMVNVTGGEKYWRRTDVKNAAAIPVLLDCMYVNLFWDETENMEMPQYDGHFVSHSIQLSMINRHLGHVNVCFADFSARRVGLKELLTLKGHRDYDTCNTWTVCAYSGDDAAGQCQDKWHDAAAWMDPFPPY